MQTAVEDRPSLPRLRQDLRLLRGAPAADGRRRWILHDPVAGRYHRLGGRAVDILSGRTDPDEGEAEQLSRFLLQNTLTERGPGAETFAKQDKAARPSLGQLLVHKYLFFRIPLVRPQAFLDALSPWVAFAFTRTFWIATALTGALGIALTARQWDVFASTFMGFLTPGGLLGYGLALVFVKALHELGHGFTAHRQGVHVPVMGVAFLVMFPVLYTDTTGAWEVKSRRGRVLIDAAGMLTELAIACFALFAWSFLPDGPARQVAFFLATTSWTMSLLVNLNPCMRFDGYYLISDSLGVANLQATGFGYGRWRMREALFGFGDPKPRLEDAEGAGLERLLLTYAYGTWVYRFFLFIGIAILVHHIFPKAIGIPLFCVEIIMFIALPVFRETKVWAGRRAEIIRSPRGRRSLVLALASALAFTLPLSGRVEAPAYVESADLQPVYAGAPARVERLHVSHGEWVEAGDMLVTLVSPEREQDRLDATLRLESARAQLARAEATRNLRDDIDPLREAVQRAEAEVAGAERLIAQLNVTAPISGRVEMPDRTLHNGRYVALQTELLAVRPARQEVVAFIPETDANRLAAGNSATLIVRGHRLEATVTELAPVAQTHLDHPALAASHGGPVAGEPDASGAFTTRQPYLRARLSLEGGTLPREGLGRAFIRAERTSFAARIWRRVAGVLIRETDF